MGRAIEVGDRVIVVEHPELGSGTVRTTAELPIGLRKRLWFVVVFADGHEGAYEVFELRVVDDAD